MALERVKTIETPTTIEVWEYLGPAGNINAKTRRNDEREESERERKRNVVAYYDGAKRRQKHYKNARWEIARLIDCNFDDATKFLTLTFAENVTDIKYCNREFYKFIKRLNRRIYKTDKMKVKYLAIWERQKRGAIHYHVVLFSLPYIKHSELEKLWGHGYIKINRVDVDQRMNVGRYISKYFSKEVDEDSYKKKKFFKSQNLIQPIEERYPTFEPPSFEGYKVAYTKEYEQLIPDQRRGYISRKVRYTKIGKEFIDAEWFDD